MAPRLLQKRHSRSQRFQLALTSWAPAQHPGCDRRRRAAERLCQSAMASRASRRSLNEVPGRLWPPPLGERGEGPGRGDHLVDNVAHRPLGAWRRPCPVIQPERSDHCRRSGLGQVEQSQRIRRHPTNSTLETFAAPAILVISMRIRNRLRCGSRAPAVVVFVDTATSTRAESLVMDCKPDSVMVPSVCARSRLTRSMNGCACCWKSS